MAVVTSSAATVAATSVAAVFGGQFQTGAEHKSDPAAIEKAFQCQAQQYMTTPVAGDVCTPSSAAGSAEQLTLPQQQYQLYDPMGQSRASDLFDLTSTVTDDSDSQFMNLGGAIDQHII